MAMCTRGNVNGGQNKSTHGVTNDINDDWVGLLIKHGCRSDFMAIKKKSKSLPLAIMEYRRVLNCSNDYIVLHELEEVFVSRDCNVIHKQLERLFLEIIPKHSLDMAINKINSVENGVEKLYNHYIENPNIRFMTHILLMK